MQPLPPRNISVVLCDDDRAMRLLVRQTLKSCADIVIVAEAGDGREAVKQVELHRPNVVVMDLEMPKLSGVDATTEILKQAPSTRVILFSANAPQEAIDEVFASGAAGYLPKQQPEQLPIAIRRVAHGCFFLGA